ncbi:MAG TPA: N-acetyl-gamma-glutamyl-phosphate reductase [Elusimicrobiota bacterium]|nr:N-acetyl-gamma-glutamyl-phosphate reductase [Elusimicrobiota bacterium]
MINVSVVGATGYTGAELLRILLNHRHVKVKHVTSESSAGKRIDEVIPSLRKKYDLVLEKPDIARLAKESDVAFFALPHGVGGRAIAEFLRHGKKAVDISADFRLKDVKAYEKWYGVEHPAPDLLKKAVYGLPELWRERIRSAALVANPGCYATAATLALLPLLRHKLVDEDSLIVDAKSGVSGAGKKLSSMYHFSEVTENFQAYAVAHHRHTPEVEQTLSETTGRPTRITFVPHLVPMNRGILAAAYATLKKKTSAAAVRAVFENDYGREKFVRLLAGEEWPQTKNVAHTNYCDINLKVDERTNRVVVLSALDNLVKGASGQAVQNMNLMFGFDEGEAL